MDSRKEEFYLIFFSPPRGFSDQELAGSRDVDRMWIAAKKKTSRPLPCRVSRGSRLLWSVVTKPTGGLSGRLELSHERDGREIFSNTKQI